jgi:hypothetical protein
LNSGQILSLSANFQKRLWPQLGLAHLEHLEVAHQPARPDAHDEAPARELIEHGGVRGHQTGMHLRQVEHAGAEADLLGERDDGGEEDERRGDPLAPRGEVLADIGLAEAQAVGEDDRFLVLGEQRRVVLVGMVEGHGEHAELDRGHRSDLGMRPMPGRRPRKLPVTPPSTTRSWPFM